MADAVPRWGPPAGPNGRPGPSFSDRVAEARTVRLAQADAGRLARSNSRPTSGVGSASGLGSGPATGSVGDIAGTALTATAIFGITSLIALLLVALVPTALPGWAATIIESSSMQPTVERGDVVILRPIERPGAGVGDVVRFPADDGGSSIVHRIVEVDLEAASYVTKGDANRNDDQAMVPFSDVDGQGIVLVPLIGHPALWYHEGRYLALALAVVAGAGVIWVGLGAGRGQDGHVGTSAGADPVAIVADAPLGRWSFDPPAGGRLFVLAAGGQPARGQPGSP